MCYLFINHIYALNYKHYNCNCYNYILYIGILYTKKKKNKEKTNNFRELRKFVWFGSD